MVVSPQSILYASDPAYETERSAPAPLVSECVAKHFIILTRPAAKHTKVISVLNNMYVGRTLTVFSIKILLLSL